MILARVPMPKLKIPRDVRATSRGIYIETHFQDVPFGATCWISCAQAWPHTDESSQWRGKLFLTLSVVSQHSACDDRLPYDMCVPPGTLFVINPLTRHWLMGAEYAHTTKQVPWIGLQWEVPRKRAPQVARDIVRTMGGEWRRAFEMDKRYASWRPTDE